MQKRRDDDLGRAGTEPAALELSDVSFSYGERTILDHASLRVSVGEACVLLGDNGAGKSTLMRLALGELAPTSGAVRVLGEGAARRRDWTCVGHVPQATSTSLATFPATVREVVRASVAGPRRAAHDRADELLDELGLGDLARRMLGELSGGQLQRVLLARALANRPRLLLLDEPTSGLDAAGARSFCELVAGLAREGVAVLLVTHDLARLGVLGGVAHVVRLTRGRIVEEACHA